MFVVEQGTLSQAVDAIIIFFSVANQPLLVRIDSFERYLA